MIRNFSRSIIRTKFQNVRSFHISSKILAAKIYGMPAMSPTMETGNIVEWKVKEGQHYNSGDSLLDIETDKATMSVDAIDDGILAKILVPNGTNDVKVGTPIAYLAEDGDDLKTLEYPKLPDESKPKEAAAAVPPTPKETATPPPASKPKSTTPPPSTPTTTSTSSSSASVSQPANPNQQLFPSVERLLEENHISREDAISKIPATGPHGRILKGDVLVYLGKIPTAENNSIAEYIQKTSHLDLSHIELLKPESTETSTNAANDKSSEKSKPKVKEPVIIQESYPIDLEISYPELPNFKNVISNAISESEQKAYSYNINSVSDLDDPLFDDIIAPPRNADRFKIDYSLISEGNEINSLDIKLTLNDACYDAKDRAAVFLNNFKTNLSNDLKQFQ